MKWNVTGWVILPDTAADLVADSFPNHKLLPLNSVRSESISCRRNDETFHRHFSLGPQCTDFCLFSLLGSYLEILIWSNPSLGDHIAGGFRKTYNR